jgi:hypothetical protein
MNIDDTEKTISHKVIKRPKLLSTNSARKVSPEVSSEGKKVVMRSRFLRTEPWKRRTCKGDRAAHIKIFNTINNNLEIE